MACDPVTGICINPPSVSCIPPLVFHTTRCECADGSMPIGFSGDGAICPSLPAVVVPSQCAVTISYPAGDPNNVQLASTPGCDSAGFELALAVALARLLGAK